MLVTASIYLHKDSQVLIYMYIINTTVWMVGVGCLGLSGCACCGRKFSYKKKLAAVWISRRMEIECCGRKYVATAGSCGLLFALLSLSIIPAFFVEPITYNCIPFAWAIVLSFVIPLFTRCKEKRQYGLHDRFLKRVFAKAGWGTGFAFIILLLGQNVLAYRLLDNGSFMKFVTYSVVCLAAVEAVGIISALVRVLVENSKLRGES